MAKSFKMEIDEAFGDYVLEERNNTAILMRKIAWNDKEPKIDIRKWIYTEEGEICNKGVSLTDSGMDELVIAATSCGFGDTKKVLQNLSTRDDFDTALEAIKNGVDTEEESDDVYYDPKELLA